MPFIIEQTGIPTTGTDEVSWLNVILDLYPTSSTSTARKLRAKLYVDDIEIGVPKSITYSESDRDVAGTLRDMGALGSGSEELDILSRTAADQYTGFIYGSTNGSATASSITDSRGHSLIVRRTSTDMEIYRNGASSATQTGSHARSAPDTSIFICAINSGGSPLGPTNRNYAFASIGTGLSDTEAANFYTAVQAFQTTLGRQV